VLHKKARLFGKRAKKSPTFWDADLVRKSRAFVCFVKFGLFKLKYPA